MRAMGYRQESTIGTQDGHVQIELGEPVQPDTCLCTDPTTLNALLNGSTSLDAALAAGKAAISGDEAALHRLLQAPNL
jgi:hypothetical protein